MWECVPYCQVHSCVRRVWLQFVPNVPSDQVSRVNQNDWRGGHQQKIHGRVKCDTWKGEDLAIGKQLGGKGRREDIVRNQFRYKN